MERLNVVFLFYIIWPFLTNQAVEYVEAPFRKYSVIFSTGDQKINNFSSEILPMIMYGKPFQCFVPKRAEELTTLGEFTYPDIKQFSDRINYMPILSWADREWYYFVRPEAVTKVHIYKYHNVYLGFNFTDKYTEKQLEGFREKGKHIFIVRHFKNGRFCSLFDQINTEVWYYCRQSKEEVIFAVNKVSECQYKIHVYTPRVCTGSNFESEDGVPIHCVSNTDAMRLVLSNDKKPSLSNNRLAFEPNFALKSTSGSPFFLAGASSPLEKDESKVHPLLEQNFHEKKCHRTDEILSATMGIPFDKRIILQNSSVIPI